MVSFLYFYTLEKYNFSNEVFLSRKNFMKPSIRNGFIKRWDTLIYMDQAASSFPKPKEVIEAINEHLTTYAANPGRGGHQLANKASNIIQETRILAAEIFGNSNPNKCLFYQNATIAINQAMKGLHWNKGDHIIASSVEHNAMRRPLEFIKDTYGVNVTYIDWNGNNNAFIDAFKKNINQSTKLVALTHSSNVTGSILPINDVFKISKKNGIITLLDASQTAGHLSIHMQEEQIDMLVFPGHKGLLGPQGIGMLLVQNDIDLNPIHHGGTGVFSEARLQPSEWPEKLESGTLNTVGIVGLNAALKLYKKRKEENVSRETLLANKLYEGLKKIEGVTCYSPNQERRIPIVAFNLWDIPSQEIAIVLDSHYNIAVRAGLHCNPLEHNTLHTLEQGIIRASLSIYNTETEIDTFIKAIEEIAEAYREI